VTGISERCAQSPHLIRGFSPPFSQTPARHSFAHAGGQAGPTTRSTWASSPPSTSARFLAGAPLKPYQPTRKPVLVAFGDLDTYLVAGRTVLASQALAGAKEGVFQLFMSQMAPGSVLQSLPAAGGRLWQSWRRLAWPQLLSLADFRKLPDRRVVRML
jgi:hypothetical protein